MVWGNIVTRCTTAWKMVLHEIFWTGYLGSARRRCGILFQRLPRFCFCIGSHQWLWAPAASCCLPVPRSSLSQYVHFFLYLWRFLFLIGVLYQVNNLCHSKAASSVNLNAFRERTTSLSEPKKPDSHCIGAKCFSHFATRPLTFFGRKTFEMLRSWNCHVYLHWKI